MNSLLLLLLIALAGVIYFEPGMEKEKKVEVLLTPYKATEVSQFIIERPGQQSMEMQRQGDIWNLQRPMIIPANRFKVQQALKFLSAQSLQQYPARELNLSSYGLDVPQARLVVGGTEIAFGGLDPLHQRRYVLVGDTLHLIGQNGLSSLVGSWLDYVSPSLFPVEAELLSLTVPGLGVLSKGVSGWSYQGENQPQSADAMQALADAWRNARALEIKQSDVSAAVGELVVLRFAGNYPELSFAVLKGEDGLVLTRQDNGLAYHFSDPYRERLLHWPAQKTVVDEE